MLSRQGESATMMKHDWLASRMQTLLSRGPLSGVGLPGFGGGFGLARGVWSGFFLICVG